MNLYWKGLHLRMAFSAKHLKFLAISVNLLLVGVVNANDTSLVDIITLPYNLHSIANDSMGEIWVAGAKGLQHYSFDKEAFITTDPHFKSHILSQNGEVISFNQMEGHKTYPWHKFAAWLSWVPPGYGRVTAAEDKLGRYWVCTGSKLFIFSVEDRFRRLYPGYSTRGIFQDGENLYVCTYRGFMSNGQKLFGSPYYIDGDIKEFGDHLMIAGKDVLLFHPETLTKEYLVMEQNEALFRSRNKRTSQSLEIIRDTIWVGTTFGLGYRDKDSILMVSQHPNVQDIIPFQDGVLLAGADFNLRKDLLSEPIDEARGGIYLWSNNELQKLDLPEISYYQIVEAGDQYYMASDSGVVVWNGDKVTSIITERDGLTDNRTCTIALDDEGFLWVSTFSGINRVNLATGKITRYIENVEFNYRSIMKNDSLIYMGSVQGVYVFNPLQFMGDDIEPRVESSSQILLMILGLGLLCSLGILFGYRFSNRKKLELGKEKLQEAERKLFLLQIEQIVLKKDYTISVSNLAHDLEVSERSLYRNFKEYGLTPGVYLRELKLKKAKYLLADNPGISVKEVAQKVGYTEIYLTKLLKD